MLDSPAPVARRNRLLNRKNSLFRRTAADSIPAAIGFPHQSHASQTSIGDIVRAVLCRRGSDEAGLQSTASQMIGYIMIVYGSATFLMNELAVDLRRTMKPRRRDDNPAGDDFLHELHRIAVHCSAPLVMEAGLYLSDETAPTVTTRLLMYLASTVEIIYRRRHFWEKVFHRRRYEAYWNAALYSTEKVAHRPALATRWLVTCQGWIADARKPRYKTCPVLGSTERFRSSSSSR